MTHDPRLPSVYLQPGELTVAEDPTVVSTVLGSCVSVTLHSPRRGFGAICHAMLPFGGAESDFRYVDWSLGYMLKCFDRFGIGRREISVKLFGGADMFETRGIPSRTLTVGQQNIGAALDLLKKEGLKPIARDVGGMQGRKLFFYPHTGEVFVKRLAKHPLSTHANGLPPFRVWGESG